MKRQQTTTVVSVLFVLGALVLTTFGISQQVGSMVTKKVLAAPLKQAPEQAPQKWVSRCSSAKVDIIGAGMKDQSTQTLSLPATATQTYLQLAGAGSNRQPPTKVAFQFATGQPVAATLTKKITSAANPTEIQPGGMLGYHYLVEGQAGPVTATVTEQTSTQKTAEALVAYYLQKTDALYTSVGDVTFQYAWGGINGGQAIGPAKLTLTLPEALGKPTTITVKSAIMDKDPQSATDRRVLVFKASANGISATKTLIAPNAGQGLNIESLTLSDVPSGTKSIEVQLSSPLNKGDQMNTDGAGDSGFLLGATASYTCIEAPPPPLSPTPEISTTSTTVEGSVEFTPCYARYEKLDSTPTPKPGENEPGVVPVPDKPSEPTEPGDKPAPKAVQYVVVLDVSGSMKQKFDGTASKTEKERRIYLTKEALKGFISNTLRLSDTLKLIAFSTSNKITLFPAEGWATGQEKAKIYDYILKAGAVEDNPYETSGGTNSANGLARAVKELKATKDPRWLQVAVFMTDGNANYTMKDEATWLNNTCARTPDGRAIDDSRCPGNKPESDWTACKNSEDPVCHSKKPTAEGSPIGQLLEQAKLIKENGVVYVVAMADAPAAGLKEAASSADTFLQAKTAPDLIVALDTVKKEVEKTIQSKCSTVCGKPTKKLTKAEADPRWVYPQVGLVTLFTPDNTTVISTPLTVSDDGLNYTFKDLKPGTYQISATLGYKAAEETTLHVYDRIFDDQEMCQNEAPMEVKAGKQGEKVKLPPLRLSQQGQCKRNFLCPSAGPSVCIHLGSAKEAVVGQPTLFKVTTSKEYQPLTFVYTFGDGAVISGTTSLTATHAYTKVGDFTATVTAYAKIDNLSREVGAARASIHVLEKLSEDKLKFASNEQNLLGEATFFKAAVEGPFSSLRYEFGDGTATITKSLVVSHTYTKTGTFTAILTAYNIYSGQDQVIGSAKTKVRIEEPKPLEPKEVEVELESNGPVISGTATLFKTKVKGDFTSLSYFFGDGAVLTETKSLTATHIYTEAGEFKAGVAVYRLVDGKLTKVGSAMTKVQVLNRECGCIVQPKPLKFGLKVWAEKQKLPADGKSTTTIHATFIGEKGNEPVNVAGQKVQFSTTLGTISQPSTEGERTVAILTSGTVTGTALVTASTGDLTDTTKVFFFVPGEENEAKPSFGEPASVIVTAGRNKLFADGKSTTVVKAKFLDAYGKPVRVPTSTVTLSTTLGTLGQPFNEGEQMVFKLTTDLVSGTATVSVKAGQATGSLQIQFVLDEGEDQEIFKIGRHGGKARSRDGHTEIEFPEGLFEDETSVIVTTGKHKPIDKGISAPLYHQRMKPLGYYLSLVARSHKGHEIKQFSKQITVTFDLQVFITQGTCGKGSDVRLIYWNDAASDWVDPTANVEGCGQKVEGNKLVVKMNHFSEFGLADTGTTAATTNYQLYLPLISWNDNTTRWLTPGSTK